MKTLRLSFMNFSNSTVLKTIITCLVLGGMVTPGSSSPDEWMPHMNTSTLSSWSYFEDDATSDHDGSENLVALSCKPNVNISLNQQGFAVITALTLVNAPEYPENQYHVDIMGPLTNTVYCAQIGQELMVLVTELLTGNACMSTIYVEDKLRPVLTCTPSVLPCNVDIESINFRDHVSVIDNCDPNPTLWYSYTIQPLPCNANGYTLQINVNWTATDNSGNSATCQDVIYLQKPAIGQILFPPDVSVSCLNPNIDPSVTGSPSYLGIPIDHLCQYVVFKTDVLIPMCNGSQKIRRTWTVKDWCTSAMVTKIQEILIVDNTPPNITCPANITLGTGPGLCTLNYTLPTPAVSDACADDHLIVVKIYVSGIPGIFVPGQIVNLGLGTTLITMKATDPCGNTRQCQYSVTVKDNVPPQIICPANITVACTASTAPANTGTATAIDFCDPSPTITYMDVTVASPLCGLGYTITRTWKATDASGNMSICMQMIVLTDNVPPVITCPLNITVACTASTAPGNTGSATATDLCDASPTITFSDITMAGACPQERTIQRTWVATDDCNNSSTCVQIIEVEDNVPPVITCPTDMTIECVESTEPGNTGFATATDDCDTSPTITFADVTVQGGPQEFYIYRTWTATDDCGNSGTCLQIILVHDGTPPVITCPSNITIQCTESTLPGLTGTATASDNCMEEPIISFTDETVGGSCPQEMTIIRTWMATDESGNTSTCTQTIVVEDNVAPVISCPSNVTISCTDSTLPANTGSATATDNCDGTPIVTFSDVISGGSCPQESTITRTWTATDDCDNSSTCVQTIFIDDNVPPVITCPVNVTIECTESTLPGNTGTATASDICDTSPTVTFSDATVGGACPQETSISRTWIATDDCGNSSTCVQSITIEDTTAPEISCPSDITISCIESTLPANTGTATATDECGENPTVTFSDVTIGGSCPQEMTITRTWSATDGCGNTSTCVQQIEVEDNDAPVILCPSDVTIQCVESTLPANTGTATADDACDNNPIVTFSDVTMSGGSCPLGSSISRTWTATDACGNSSTCVQMIVIDDTEAPEITCPADMTLQCSGNTSPDNTGTATATDNCDTSPEVTFSDITSGAGCPAGFTITRTWVATDDCGNSSSCIQTILVDDTVAPVITCPSDVTIECSESTQPANTGTATATDMCDSSPLVTFSDATVGTACAAEYTITRTWMATDNCGNTSTCTQTIVLEDTTAPICVPMNITVSINGNGMVTIQGSDVDGGSTDNCGPITFDVTPNTFNCDSLGDHVVVLTVTDCAGNTSTCTAIVTVIDDGSLEALCQNVTIFIDAAGNAFLDPLQVDNGSGGGCSGGNLEYDLSQTDFNCTNLGSNNIVTLTVTDENGGTATCTAVITVVDLIPPMITCPANITVDCHAVTDPNNTGQFGNATATDNCPPAIVTETHVINLNNCNVGTITRTFTATDGSGNTATCTQVVTVSNPNPLDEDDITWPASPVNVNICNSTAPANIPNGVPVIDPIALLCANPVTTFLDNVQTIVDNDPNTPCKIITRTWTIVDNCQMNVSFMFVQTIFVIDMVPPLFTNINDMTKVANANCVANFTLIASATDCAGVSITNNSPYGATTGANASGNYPIGVTTVIFTATDGCGNISTMDVVLTVTDPNPTMFLCEKVIFFLPPETEIAIHAEDFITFIEGNCTGPEDFIISYSGTLPFDTVHIFDCGDVGVHTFPLFFWNATGTVLIGMCNNADLDLRDPDDFCMDGPIVQGIVESEDGHYVSGVEVSIMNAPMVPDTTNIQGRYMIRGLNSGTSYEVAPFRDDHHREGVSTLDLVLIQKHLLGKAKLNSPYKLIAADANRSGHLTALDLLEIRKLILGIYSKYPQNTSWRFVDMKYSFPDPYNPFNPKFPESVWIDSVTQGSDIVDFIGIKIGDVNGTYFKFADGEAEIKPRSGSAYELELKRSSRTDGSNRKWELVARSTQGYLDGMQFSLFVGAMSSDQLKEVGSDLLTEDQWYYDPVAQTINVSWTVGIADELTGRTILYGPEMEIHRMQIDEGLMEAETYLLEGTDILIRKIQLNQVGDMEELANDYHLYQNIPNPFSDGTLIRFSLPKEEVVKVAIYDMTGRQVFLREANCHSGINEFAIKNSDLGVPGIYYYTLYTPNASLTRKMSYTMN